MALLSDEELLARLISFDSTSDRSNLPLADFICDYLSPFAAETLRIGPIEAEGKTNVVVRIGEDRGDHTGLILSGHMDVVPAREPDWRSDPFTMVTDDSRLYGRGVSDMKGFLAVAMNAAIRASRQPLDHPLWLLFTYDEEVGTLGAKYFAQEWDRSRRLPRDVIIGEPTSLRAARMHKGHFKIRVRTAGRSAHSGYPHLGENAIEKASVVLEGLIAARRSFEEKRTAESRYFGAVPWPPLNIGLIRGGTAVNIVPDSCEIDAGVRLLPGMSTAEAMREIQEHIGDATLELLSDSPPLLLPESAPILRDLTAHIGQSDTETVGFATDAGWLQALGMECVLFGPGSIEVAHRPNEWIERSQLRDAAPLVDFLIDQRTRGGR